MEGETPPFFMLDDFCDKLEGFYDNWNQACRNPAVWSHVKLRWKRIGDHQFESKQWYEYLGEEKAYRHKWHKVYEQQGTIIVQNWTVDWKDHNHCCDMLFFEVAEHYAGKVKTDACIVNGGRVVSLVKFDGNYYKSRDQGWRDDKVVWGSDVIYRFDKVG